MRPRTKFWPVGTAAAAALGVLTVAAHRASAMEMRVAGNQLILSGFIVGDEFPRVKDILSRSPGIDTVVLRTSPGGDPKTAFRLGALFRVLGLNTAVSGWCYSACALSFLGGKRRFFTDDFPPQYTNLGFHGDYGRDGKLLPDMVRKLNLKGWIVDYSDGKADPAMVQQWLSIPTNHGLIHFYNPAQYRREGASTFLCEGPLGDISTGPPCEPVKETALDLGLVTSPETVHSNDQVEIRPAMPTPPPASGYAAIDDLDKLPLSTANGRWSYLRFLNGGSLSPRAFAISPDGNHFAASIGAVDSLYMALANCQYFAKVSCRLYAVDDTVVWQPPEPARGGETVPTR